MRINSKYDLGQIVFLKTDEDQKGRMVTQITIAMNGVRYALSCGTTDTWHYEIEISESADVLKKFT